MAYRLIFGKKDYTSSDYEVALETAQGHRGYLAGPSGGGPLPESIKERLPSEFIVKSGSTTREFARCVTEYFTLTDPVKAALEPFAARFEYFPLNVVDIRKGAEEQNSLWLLYPPDRAQVINLVATGDALVIEQSPPEVINGKLVSFREAFVFGISNVSSYISKRWQGCTFGRGLLSGFPAHGSVQKSLCAPQHLFGVRAISSSFAKNSYNDGYQRV